MSAEETMKIIIKQWCNLADLMKLLHCGRNKALDIKKQIKDKLISEGYYIPPDAPNNQNGKLAWHPEYYHYTHETIKRIAEGDSWLPSNFPNKQVATYGKTTVYYLTQNGVNENNGIHDYTQTLQMSINLGKWSD